MPAIVHDAWVNVKRARARVLVLAVDQIQGMGVSSDRFQWTSLDDPLALGTDVQGMLKQSRHLRPGETNQGDLDAPYIKAFEFKSKKQYREALDIVDIRENGGVLRITPYENRGARLGHYPIKGVAAFDVPVHDAAAIGEAIVKALAIIDRHKIGLQG